jgi:hypothetical protein
MWDTFALRTPLSKNYPPYTTQPVNYTTVHTQELVSGFAADKISILSTASRATVLCARTVSWLVTILDRHMNKIDLR